MASQGIAVVGVSLLLVVALSRCGGGDAARNATISEELASAPVPPLENGAIAYQGADAAGYYILSVERREKGHVVATTRRDGTTSGINYARREYICKTDRFRYLAEADTKAKLDAKPDEGGPFDRLVTGSSSYLAGQAACRLAERGGR